MMKRTIKAAAGHSRVSAKAAKSAARVVYVKRASAAKRSSKSLRPSLKKY